LETGGGTLAGWLLPDERRADGTAATATAGGQQ
jgi:hypothetical protein